MPLEPRKVFQSEAEECLTKELPALSVSWMEFRAQLPAAMKGLSLAEA